MIRFTSFGCNCSPIRLSGKSYVSSATSTATPLELFGPRGRADSNRGYFARIARIEQPSEDSAVVYRAVDFEHSVHLDARGNILAGNGKLDELASLAAYACRIASLVGRQLSFGDLTGMETTLSSGTYFLNREENGEIVCIKPRPHLNLIQLRTQLNL